MALPRGAGAMQLTGVFAALRCLKFRTGAVVSETVYERVLVSGLGPEGFRLKTNCLVDGKG